MTREEAIYELSNIFAFGFYNDRVDEAANMAIKALEQEETSQNLTKPNKSDLISRHEALKGYQSVCEGIACHECRAKDADGTCRLESFINNLPTAQPFTAEQIQTMQELESAQIEKAYELGKADRPTGHWIEDEKQNVLMRKFIEKGEVWRVCSVCGAGLMIGAEYETDKYYHETFHNYCPNCGADMRGGPTLTPEEFAEKMAGIAENGDEERKHVAADSIMCELLKSLGFGEGVGIFEDMDKWYS